MARQSRYTQQIFGSTAGSNQIAEFGSYAASSPATYSGTTITPAIIQTLANYLSGWFGAVVGSNSPAIEDMNAICYLYAYQLSYLFQLGIPEWDSGTTYYAGSMCQDGAGNLYVSLTNANLNNALSSTTNWRTYTKQNNLTAVNPLTGTYASPYTVLTTDTGKTFLVNSANGAMTFNLPAPASCPLGFNFVVKDAGFTGLYSGFGVNNCTLVQHASEKIENVAASFVMQASGGEWEISTDNTNWWVTGR